MNTSSDGLSLTEALQRWCDNDLVQRVRDEECRHTEYEMDNFSRIQLTSRAVRRQPHRQDWMVGSDFSRLIAAWEELERDLRQNIEKGRIHVRGVRLAPDRRTQPEIIPPDWAADFLFDFGRGTIKAGLIRFGAIECSRVPWTTTTATNEAAATPTPAPIPAAAWVRTLRPEDLPDLDDETVLALLNEHTRRVIENGSQLIAPGKVSLLPLILGKMKARAANGELEPTQAAECRWLALWITEVAPEWHGYKASSIELKLSADYKRLKPTSTPNI